MRCTSPGPLSLNKKGGRKQLITTFHERPHTVDQIEAAFSFLFFFFFFFTEEKEILSRWTEYCSELYNYESCRDNAVLDCSQSQEEDLQPILREEVAIAVASLKKGKSAGVDNIPAELVQAGGETMIDILTEICNRIWRTGE